MSNDLAIAEQEKQALRAAVERLRNCIANGICNHCCGMGVANGRVVLQGRGYGTCKACGGEGTGKAQLAAISPEPSKPEDKT